MICQDSRAPYISVELEISGGGGGGVVGMVGMCPAALHRNLKFNGKNLELWNLGKS